ncbi:MULTISPECIES: carbohydrate ABC transporter permease [unclassified Paenibacillus]|uniref:carbohydrate ABC transporter permease n=1 Tax=unclassified Paenibacillus TaxID=185978 RepID=UPI002787E237|nr:MULTISPECIES: carbohydrate ABC transporter permease [unclassified Paenibacillus]MDQ0901100.1 putative aldouronate transport system permease protein [Paenibacillus sp. V4I7]MDQ0920402.1 putative aldouronate transport system permease protein [Paenibacillus sp. V4I5]
MKRLSVSNALIAIILGLCAIAAVFPFYQTLVLSLSTLLDRKAGGVMLFPRSIDLSSYQYIFHEGKVVNGLLISVFVTVLGTLVNLVVTTTGAYALSKNSMPGRNVILTCIIFTMFFSGGLIPYYLTIQSLHLQNNLLVMILPAAVNAFNLILMKNFFGSVNPALEESAKIDGANDFSILIRVVIPVSLPIMATMSLFYAVDRWNEWYLPMLFINDINLHPLQLVLRDTITNLSQSINSPTGQQLASQMQNVYPESVKSAMIIVSAIPILMVYPFVQKHFNAGVMIGSVKE